MQMLREARDDYFLCELLVEFLNMLNQNYKTRSFLNTDYQEYTKRFKIDLSYLYQSFESPIPMSPELHRRDATKF